MSSRRADRALWWLAVILFWFAGLALVGGRVQSDLLPQIVTFCERSWREVSEHAWLSGLASLPLFAAISLGRGLVTAVRVTRSTRNWVADLGDGLPPGARVKRIAREVGLDGRVTLVPDRRLLAVTVGLLRPRVLVTTGLASLFDDEELRAVLVHERHHVVHRDPLKALLIYALTDACFFLPIARDLREMYFVHKELAADRDAIEATGHRRSLASALLKLVDANAVSPAPALALGAFSPAHARLAQLTGHSTAYLAFSRRRLAYSVGITVVLLLIAAAIFIEPAHAAKMAQCEPETLFTPVSH